MTYIFDALGQFIDRPAGRSAHRWSAAPGPARRFRVEPPENGHPVDGIEDPLTAIAGLAAAFVVLGGRDAPGLRMRLAAEARSAFRLTAAETDELMAVAGWLLRQCGNADAAINRLSRRLSHLSGRAGIAPLTGLVQATLAPDGTLDAALQGALDDVAAALRAR